MSKTKDLSAVSACYSLLATITVRSFTEFRMTSVNLLGIEMKHRSSSHNPNIEPILTIEECRRDTIGLIRLRCRMRYDEYLIEPIASFMPFTEGWTWMAMPPNPEDSDLVDANTIAAEKYLEHDNPEVMIVGTDRPERLIRCSDLKPALACLAYAPYPACQIAVVTDFDGPIYHAFAPDRLALKLVPEAPTKRAKYWPSYKHLLEYASSL